ncbi:rhodanese-like domain-containing protein [Tessaracoccus sp. G1721]
MNADEVTECTVSDLHAAWKRGEYILDVREPDEYAEGHVPSAVLIPLGEVASRVDEVPAGRTVYVVCRSGRRSMTGARALAAAGRQAISVRGGTMGWISAGLPVSARLHGADAGSR